MVMTVLSTVVIDKDIHAYALSYIGQRPECVIHFYYVNPDYRLNLYLQGFGFSSEANLMGAIGVIKADYANCHINADIDKARAERDRIVKEHKL